MSVRLLGVWVACRFSPCGSFSVQRLVAGLCLDLGLGFFGSGSGIFSSESRIARS